MINWHSGESHIGAKREDNSMHLRPQRISRDVYSRKNYCCTREIVEWQNYKHLDWITVRKDDDILYKLKEGNFHRLRIQDIEDMLLLLVQGKLTNLNVEVSNCIYLSPKMFTRCIGHPKGVAIDKRLNEKGGIMQSLEDLLVEGPYDGNVLGLNVVWFGTCLGVTKIILIELESIPLTSCFIGTRGCIFNKGLFGIFHAILSVVTKLATGRLVNGLSCDRIDMVIKKNRLGAKVRCHDEGLFVVSPLNKSMLQIEILHDVVGTSRYYCRVLRSFSVERIEQGIG
ncbi:hypothetical protein Tco_0271682 [Tanacetum coccineum]